MITKRIGLSDLLMLMSNDTPISVMTDNGIPLPIGEGDEVYRVSDFVDDDISSICKDISVVGLNHTGYYIDIAVSGEEYRIIQVRTNIAINSYEEDI